MISNLDITEDESLHFYVQDLGDSLDNTTFLGNNLQDRIMYFHRYVRDLHTGGYTYLEAIVKFCDEHDIEYEDSVKLISPDLKGEMWFEAINNNQIKNQDVGQIGF
jgi:hypothetical protein